MYCNRAAAIFRNKILAKSTCTICFLHYHKIVTVAASSHQLLYKYNRNLSLSSRTAASAELYAEIMALLAPNDQMAPANIISNGTCSIGSCVALRTPEHNYLFDCPEGVGRLLNALKLKTERTTDIFVTAIDWHRFCGISSVLMDKATSVRSSTQSIGAPKAVAAARARNMRTRLHGVINMKAYLAELVTMIDHDNKGSALDSIEMNIADDKFEDSTLTAYYIPLIDSHDRTRALNYLVELKPMLQHVDLQKLVALRIPKGPLIGRLKSGETVTLDDGRIIQPADIYTEMESDCAHQSTVLFANCPSRALFHCLKESPHLRRFEDKDSTPLDFIVHFTTDNVLNSDEYRRWMDDFGDVTKHLIVNGSSMCPIVPVLDGVYRTQSKLTGVVGNVMFPELYAAANMVTDDEEEVNIQGSNNRIFAKPKQLYRLRMSKRCTQPDADLLVVDETNATIDDAGISVELNRLRDEYQKGICDFQTVDDFSADEQTNHKDVFPRLTTLGTSSSVPTKYRNQSGYLLELDASYALMLDCGDNTYGQMMMLYGSIRCAQMLMRLKLIALSHQHLDHIGGLVTIVKRRHEAFLAAGVEYEPLLVAAPWPAFRQLSIYSTHLSNDVTPLIDTIRHDVRNGMTDYGKQISGPIKRFIFVPVPHTRTSVGFVIVTTAHDRKIVYSGDTMHCPALADAGMYADLLIHEATFDDAHRDHALHKRHSTMADALSIARRMHARNVLLTHFSTRQTKVPMLPDYLDDYTNVGIAMDLMVLRYCDLGMLSRLVPILRLLYRDELMTCAAGNERKQAKREVEYLQTMRNRLKNDDDRHGDMKRSKQTSSSSNGAN